MKNLIYPRVIPLVFWLMVVWVFAFLPGCRPAPKTGSLEDIQKRGFLIVMTRNAPTTYYEGRDGLAGLEYEMATSFAEHLGVQVEFKEKDTVPELLGGLAEGKGDFSAAGLTRTSARSEVYLPGPVYQMVRQQVVCRRGGARPKKPADLVGLPLTVIAGSSYVERLSELKSGHPDLTWIESETGGTEGLLEKVWEGKIPCTVADSNIVAINRRYFPELVVAFDLTEPEPLVWYFPGDAKEFKTAVEDWFEEFKDDGSLDLLLEKYYGFIEIFDYVDTRAFVRAIEQVLPHYRALFRKTATEFNIPWTLLAAQAYQESHWNPRAKSPTGVKGLMMLTRPTAKEVGVTNRLDPEQSLVGGARYLKKLRQRLPDDIVEPDRTWIALAAYNVGMGHVWDARTLARRLGKDPDRWSGLSEVLPLLSQKKYYKTVKYGYARGREPVRYVNRIRDYRDILEKTIEGRGN